MGIPNLHPAGRSLCHSVPDPSPGRGPKQSIVDTGGVAAITTAMALHAGDSAVPPEAGVSA